MLLTVNGIIERPVRDGSRGSGHASDRRLILDEPLKRITRIGEELHLHEIRA